MIDYGLFMMIYKPAKLIYSSVHIDRVYHFIRDHFSRIPFYPHISFNGPPYWCTRTDRFKRNRFLAPSRRRRGVHAALQQCNSWSHLKKIHIDNGPVCKQNSAVRVQFGMLNWGNWTQSKSNIALKRDDGDLQWAPNFWSSTRIPGLSPIFGFIKFL